MHIYEQDSNSYSIHPLPARINIYPSSSSRSAYKNVTPTKSVFVYFSPPSSIVSLGVRNTYFESQLLRRQIRLLLLTDVGFTIAAVST